MACDIPSVIYQYIWNPEVWSSYYASGSEIFKYFQNTVKKFGLERYIRLRHQVDRAEWLEDEGIWKVTVTDMQTGEQFDDQAEVFVNAMGFLKCVYRPSRC